MVSVINGIERRWALRVALMVITLWGGFSWSSAGGEVALKSAPTLSDESQKLWRSLIAQADVLNLPTGFLKMISPGFVTLEFDDLHAFAAEYHPDEHRMVLNRTLSFNAAGGTLKTLASLPPRDLGTLYHELFHAYMDYISRGTLRHDAKSPPAQLLAFAKDQQECRYRYVSITPILQRKNRTETRFLTDRESWEALNEAWAVFVGWAVWTHQELRKISQNGGKTHAAEREWLTRLKKADRDGDLIGYYEPEDSAEQMIARKRYLAPSHRMSPQEVALLLEHVLEYPREEARRSAKVMEQNRPSLSGSPPCTIAPNP